MSKKLTPKQLRFVDEYLIDLNATQAAKRAGYSEKTAGQIGERLLKNVEIQSVLSERMKAREKRTGITQDRVLQELEKLMFFDIRTLYNADGSLKLPTELDDVAAAALVGVDVIEVTSSATDKDGNVQPAPVFTKKVKAADKIAALTLGMRHLGMLNDKLEVSAELNINALSDDELDAAIQRAAAEAGVSLAPGGKSQAT